MKTAIYIEDGVVQLVITPENDFEKNALKSFDSDAGVDAKIIFGSFYDCRGGWVRQTRFESPPFGPGENSDRSLILRNKANPKCPT